MNQEKIGSFIKEIRKKNNLTQKELGDKYGVSYQAVSKWETGKNLPDISLIKQMSKDFNINIEDILEGEFNNNNNNSVKKNNWLIPLLVVIAILILMLILLIFNHNHDNDFEFKTISSTCSDFKIYGSIAYNENKSSINIANINYCGGNDKEKYKKIECDLYETHGNTKIKITSCDYNQKNSMTLEDYLQNITLNIDNYSRVCNAYTDESLYLEINAFDNEDKITSYKIPLLIDDNCKK